MTTSMSMSQAFATERKQVELPSDVRQARQGVRRAEGAVQAPAERARRAAHVNGHTAMSAKRPSKRHCNIVRNRGSQGYDEDQLARFLGITRETMRGWAKLDADFARAREEALLASDLYWEREDAKVRERDERDQELAANARKFGHLPHRQQQATAPV